MSIKNKVIQLKKTIQWKTSTLVPEENDSPDKRNGRMNQYLTENSRIPENVSEVYKNTGQSDEQTTRGVERQKKETVKNDMNLLNPKLKYM